MQILQVSSPVHNIFELILIGLTEFVSNYIKERLRFFEITWEKDLKFISYDGYNAITFNILLMLLLTL